MNGSAYSMPRELAGHVDKGAVTENTYAIEGEGQGGVLKGAMAYKTTTANLVIYRMWTKNGSKGMAEKMGP